MARAPKVAVNGFGRIGRLVTRCLLEMEQDVDLVAVNDLADPGHLAHLFSYDSTHGRYAGDVQVEDGHLVVDGDRFRVLAEKDPADLPWKDLEADIVVESTGRFSKHAELQKHLDAGAGRVVLSAPGEADATIVRGVNEDTYDPDRHRIVSNASCTTNCLAPVLKVLDDAFTVQHGMMTTVHAYTNDQRLLDSQHSDLRRARAAALSMVPTSTGAARAIGDVLPGLAGKIDGMAIRVPVANVSVVDLTARLGTDVAPAQVEDAFHAAARGALAGILRAEERPLVSADFNHDPHSAIVDLPALMVIDASLAKVLAWYDNEWAYAMRTAELVHAMWRREH